MALVLFIIVFSFLIGFLLIFGIIIAIQTHKQDRAQDFRLVQISDELSKKYNSRNFGRMKTDLQEYLGVSNKEYDEFLVLDRYTADKKLADNLSKVKIEAIINSLDKLIVNYEVESGSNPPDSEISTSLREDMARNESVKAANVQHDSVDPDKVTEVTEKLKSRHEPDIRARDISEKMEAAKKFKQELERISGKANKLF